MECIYCVAKGSWPPHKDWAAKLYRSSCCGSLGQDGTDRVRQIWTEIAYRSVERFHLPGVSSHSQPLVFSICVVWCLSWSQSLDMTCLVGSPHVVWYWAKRTFPPHGPRGPSMLHVSPAVTRPARATDTRTNSTCRCRTKNHATNFASSKLALMVVCAARELDVVLGFRLNRVLVSHLSSMSFFLSQLTLQGCICLFLCSPRRVHGDRHWTLCCWVRYRSTPTGSAGLFSDKLCDWWFSFVLLPSCVHTFVLMYTLLIRAARGYRLSRPPRARRGEASA